MFCFVLLIHGKCILSFSDNNFWTNNLINYILKLKLYQITLFINGSDFSIAEEHRIIQQVVSILPTVIVDFSNIESTSHNVITTMKAFDYPRQTTIYMVSFVQTNYIEDIHFQEIKSLLDFLINLSPKTMRSRCLFIYSKVNSISENLLQLILRYAWTKKFLDFSILTVQTEYNQQFGVNVHHYNPFSDSYSNLTYSLDEQVFPDKLNDMKRYPIRVPFLYHTYLMSVKVHNENVSFDGSGVSLLRGLGRILNYTLDISITEKNLNGSSMLDYFTNKRLYNLDEKMKDMVRRLGNNEFNMLGFPMYSTSIEPNDEEVEKSVTFIYEKFGVIVSTSATTGTDTSLVVLFDLLINVCIITVSIYVAYRLKIIKKAFDYLFVLKVSLGQWITAPRATNERIIFFCIVCLSMTYISSIFAKITETHVQSDKLSLSTAEDVVKSNLAPYINGGFFTIYFKDRDIENTFRKLKSSLRVVNMTSTCFNLLLTNPKTLCFSDYKKFRPFFQNHEQSDGCPRFRFSNFEFLDVRYYLFFEKASPFVEKFNMVLQRLADSGFFEHWDRRQKYKPICLEDQREYSSVESKNQRRRRILYILVCGYALSLVTFLCEFVIKLLK